MNRYPGIRPFRTDEQHLFFGRQADIERLHRLVDLEQIVILYGKSGYGKSSLLSAGLYPRLDADGIYRHWEIRFGPCKGFESIPPAQALMSSLQGNDPGENALKQLFPGEASLWQALKQGQAAGQNRFMLCFDQFEELFTYPPEQILDFKKQLAEALYSRVPQRLEKAIAAANLAPELEDGLYQPFELKVLFSIRADRMSLLNNLKDYLPNLLLNAYELDALEEEQAREAVVIPASLGHVSLPPAPSEGGGAARAHHSGKELEANELEAAETETLMTHYSDKEPGATGAITSPPPSEGAGGRLDTPPFFYSQAALATIFSALRNDRHRIETSALQIVCKHVENAIIAPRAAQGVFSAKLVVEAADLGDLRTIFRDFYENTIQSLPAVDQSAARHLVEEVLISRDGIRLPFAEAALLKESVVTRELLDALERASLLRKEQDGLGRMIYEVGHDTLVAPIAEAAKARRAVEEKKRLRREAKQQREEKEKALAARRRARALAAGAVALALFAFAALASAIYQRNILRKTTGQVVGSLLQDAREAILRLKYDEAWDKTGDAAKLGERQKEVARQFMEIAYFYGETGHWSKAIIAGKQAAEMYGNNELVNGLEKIDIANQDGALETFRLTLQKLDAVFFDSLQSRYYPVMLAVEGGEFWMGCDSSIDKNCSEDELPRHRVRLDDYRLARSEATFWQYNVYLTAVGKNIFKDHKAVSWGFEGDNPAVNVSWYDAILYCNWLSAWSKLDPAYSIDSVGRSQDAGWEVKINKKAKGFQLPTEAEWEYAARGGLKQERYIYVGRDSLDLVGWYAENSTSRSHPVERKQANGAGFFDMSGNVFEWCWDWYRDYPSELLVNPSGPAGGIYRCVRGGSWSYFPASCRTVFRYNKNPDFRNNGTGFRVVQHP